MRVAKRPSRGPLRISLVAAIVLLATLVVAIRPLAVSSPGFKYNDESQELRLQTEAPEDPSFHQVDVVAPLPYLQKDAARSFNALRKAVIAGAGFDFLARCGDLLRTGNGRPSKIGTIHKSRHKSGEAFDYNQEDPRVLLVREYEAGRLRWRTYLVCTKQNGSQGVKLDLRTDNAGFVSVYAFDFTAAAETLGWERIFPQEGWAYQPIKKEFWHYQLRRQFVNESRSLTYPTPAEPKERSEERSQTAQNHKDHTRVFLP